MPYPALRLSPTMSKTGCAAYNTGDSHKPRINRKDRIISPEIVLRAEQLTKQVTSPEGTLTILDAVDLEVRDGESVAVVGVSGAGKS
ncbi:MAG: hypothetical protein R3348_03800, partial [Xanthomonadales bacterium]|nr:hypothetical protein [Xanthomonadales bacterium]